MNTRRAQQIEAQVAAKGKLSNLMEQVITEKQQNVQKALDGRVNVLEGLMIGGDAFSMGYLGFEGIQLAKPSLSKIPAIKTATMICGTIAGVINIAVAIICLKEGIQAWKNGDKKLAMRLILDFVCFLIIGSVMILASLALKVTALGAISAFLAANPWLMPVMFFVVSVPVFVEILTRIVNSMKKQDYAAELDKGDLNQLIEGKDQKNPLHLAPLKEMLQRGVQDVFVKEHLSQKMEALQADMGVEAAIETFRLLKQVLNKEEFDEQQKRAKKKIAKWNRAQYVRLFQQVLFAGAFGLSMGKLMNPKINTPAVNSSQSFAMSAANAIPLYMDINWPFMRNAPIVVPKAS